MNPEFQRNLWLEMTPQRIGMMAGILGLIFFAAAVQGSWIPGSLNEIARGLFYVIVVGWGTRNAALSVVGEIRDRTWDFQRLSSLSPGAMMWGKLFGATVYNWFGGAICVVAALLFAHQASTLVDFTVAIIVGVIAQGAAFLASLVAVRRRQTHTRRDIFIYQLVGLTAAGLAYSLWAGSGPLNALTRSRVLGEIAWWGGRYDTRTFCLVSFVLLLVWILVGCYRAMRIELKMHNGPFVWIGFLIFMGVYFAGFEPQNMVPQFAGIGHMSEMRLLFAAIIFGGLTYVMVLLEPKDRVHFRWLSEQFSQRKFSALFDGLSAWMISYVATALVVPPLLLLSAADELGAAFVILAMLGFLTRDIGIFILMQTRTGKRSGDYMALACLLALYILLPMIFNGMGLQSSQFLFFPAYEPAPMLAVVAGWGEAVAVLTFAIRRLALPEPQPVLK